MNFEQLFLGLYTIRKVIANPIDEYNIINEMNSLNLFNIFYCTIFNEIFMKQIHFQSGFISIKKLYLLLLLSWLGVFPILFITGIITCKNLACAIIMLHGFYGLMIIPLILIIPIMDLIHQEVRDRAIKVNFINEPQYKVSSIALLVTMLILLVIETIIGKNDGGEVVSIIIKTVFFINFLTIALTFPFVLKFAKKKKKKKKRKQLKYAPLSLIITNILFLVYLIAIFPLINIISYPIIISYLIISTWWIWLQISKKSSEKKKVLEENKTREREEKDNHIPTAEKKETEMKYWLLYSFYLLVLSIFGISIGYASFITTNYIPILAILAGFDIFIGVCVLIALLDQQNR